MIWFALATEITVKPHKTRFSTKSACNVSLAITSSLVCPSAAEPAAIQPFSETQLPQVVCWTAVTPPGDWKWNKAQLQWGNTLLFHSFFLIGNITSHQAEEKGCVWARLSTTEVPAYPSRCNIQQQAQVSHLTREQEAQVCISGCPQAIWFLVELLLVPCSPPVPAHLPWDTKKGLEWKSVFV